MVQRYGATAVTLTCTSTGVILERRVRQHSPPPSSKHQLREKSLEEWCPFPALHFQGFESEPRHAEAVLAICGGPKLYYVF